MWVHPIWSKLMLILLMVQCPELGDWFSSSPDIKTGAGGGEWIETMSRFILVLTFSIRKSDNITGDELGQAQVNHDNTTYKVVVTLRPSKL